MISLNADRFSLPPDPAMKRLDFTPVPVNPAFAINVSVSEAAAVQGIMLTVGGERADLACELCGQSVMCVRIGSASYRLTTQAIAGSVLSHLIQAHRWTRELPGER